MDLDFIMEMRQELLRLRSSGELKLDPRFKEAVDMLTSSTISLIGGERKKWKSVEVADPPVGFTGILVRGEKWQDCPYYNGHKYLRPFVHLHNCRRRYKAELEKQGNKLDIEICRYNWTHHIPKNELEEHELQCEDQSMVYVYLHDHILQQRAENQRMYRYE